MLALYILIGLLSLVALLGLAILAAAAWWLLVRESEVGAPMLLVGGGILAFSCIALNAAGEQMRTHPSCTLRPSALVEAP